MPVSHVKWELVHSTCPVLGFRQVLSTIMCESSILYAMGHVPFVGMTVSQAFCPVWSIAMTDVLEQTKMKPSKAER
jgi:hypothetical protein